uniref:Uncharacterized protein n=1 Tax=Florenciella parvula TaxID=236787 RepID=A0A7S2CKA8_9STRA|mmetsp:Transcript_29928/g.61329  ORF Transcript_29928/g.61329 Transcript_29928/m.61329 type:complete len:112 (+) Transcript_29928:131-466(+)
MDAVCCAKCCQIFSVSGVVFLSLIGILLQTQPIYIKDVEDPADAASQCFQAAGIYAFFIVATTICGYVQDKKKQHMRDHMMGDEGDGPENLALKEDRFARYGYGAAPPARG